MNQPEGIVELDDLSCPLCGKRLPSDEYSSAVNILRKKVEEGNKGKLQREKENHSREVNRLAKVHKDELDKLESSHNEQTKHLQQQFDKSIDKQLKALESHYKKVNNRAEKSFKAFETSITREHAKMISEKVLRIKKLEKAVVQVRSEAKTDARAEAQQDLVRLKKTLTEKDLQIQRAKLEAESLKQKLTESQAELKGEAGELDLYATLTRAFPEDIFRRQRRGQVSGDLIQQIRTGTGRALQKAIIYDNKEGESVTKKDLQKAKGYRSIHGTNYVIIVSSNLPKSVENRLCGEKEGILLIHPSIVAEVSRQIRSGIIEIAKQSGSKVDRETKEKKLYDYVRSHEFSGRVETISSVYHRMSDLQDREERAHRRLWKDRKEIQRELNDVYADISTSVESVLQERPVMEELSAE